MLQFRTDDGRQVRTATDVGEWSQRRDGSKVPVRYLPSAPDKARIDDLRDRGYLNVVFSLVAAAISVAAGLFFLPLL